MKELSIEEKARAYDEAIKRLKDIETGKCQKTFMFTEGLFDYIFPELKESEDERIRKSLAAYFAKFKPDDMWNEDFSFGDILAWFKKQEQHKKFLDSIQIGDKVTRNKDGVLVNLSQLSRVAKKDEKQGEQKPVFEMKTPEESLGIDSDTYNKIVDECIYGEQKPAAWSEEDEHRINNTIYFLETAKKHYASTVELDACIDLVKSIRHQNRWKPSERQKEALLWCVVHLGGADKQVLGELLEELNKL